MIEIAGRKIGFGYPPVLSCELSISHNGNLDTALQMIDEAAKCGADACKLQYYVTEDFTKPDGEMITYKQVAWSGGVVHHKDLEKGIFPNKHPYQDGVGGYLLHEITEPIYDLFKRNEIDLTFVKACQKRAKEHDLIFGVTTTSIQGVKEMAELNIDYLKVSSDMINNKEMIREMTLSKIPIIASTGHIKSFTELAEWDLTTLKTKLPHQTLFLHCESSYSAEYPKLWKLKHLQWFLWETIPFTKGLAGYSHHSQGIDACIRATELGAVWVEVHYTHSKTASGPDHFWSLDEKELKQLVEAVK